MRRLALYALALVPGLIFSCATGNKLSRFDNDGGSGGGWSGEPGHTENENEPDPGSTDPGVTGGGGAGGTSGASGGGDIGEECVHDPCTPGQALDPNCHPCVFEVCQADAYCCQGEWDDTCIGQATSCACDPGGSSGDPGGTGGAGGAGGDPGGTGGGGGVPDPGTGGGDPGGSSSSSGGGPDPGTCSHEVCIVGDALDAACDPCAEAVCAADDFCCTVEWDVFCLLTVVDLCPEACL